MGGRSVQMGQRYNDVISLTSQLVIIGLDFYKGFKCINQVIDYCSLMLFIIKNFNCYKNFGK